MIAAIDYRARNSLRGYQPSYASGSACPACGHRAWHVGRHSAECGRCGTALPLSPEVAHG